MRSRVAGVCMGLMLLGGVAWAAPEDTRFQGGSYDGWDEHGMTNGAGLGGALVTFSSGADQTFDWSEPSPVLAPMLLAIEDPGIALTNGTTLGISVPSAFTFRFYTNSIVSCSGSAAGKVGAPSFSADGRTLRLPLIADFAAGDELTVSGVRLVDLNLSRPGTGRLEMDLDGDGARDVHDQYALLLRVQWPGGSYDGWDENAMADSRLLCPQGTVFQIARGGIDPAPAAP